LVVGVGEEEEKEEAEEQKSLPRLLRPGRWIIYFGKPII